MPLNHWYALPVAGMSRVKLVPGHKSSCPIVVIDEAGEGITVTGKLIGALEPQALMEATDTFPLVAEGVAVIIFVELDPVHPAGKVQV